MKLGAALGLLLFGCCLLQQGQSPQIQAGFFSADAMTVDHIVLPAAAPEHGNVIANLVFLPLELKSAKGDNIGESRFDMARKIHAAGVITQERLQETLLRQPKQITWADR